jgi:Zn-dependent peptidase ImmA (M78 family)
MALDLQIFSSKLRKYREQFQLTLKEVSENTGIPEALLNEYEQGLKQPTGDEILIIADYYKCDYKFFISNELLAPFDQTETLFRSFSNELSKEDRWAIQEFLFLCECEEYLMKELKYNRKNFTFTKRGTFFKVHGEQASTALRKHLGYRVNQVGSNVYDDFRSIGLHIFRRQLQNANISGLYIKHPIAGKCVLVNYNEDIYRQRFTVAHEAGHALLDNEKDAVISFTNTSWKKDDLSEVRANTFTSRYLMPPEFLKSIPITNWDIQRVTEWASKLKVNIDAFVYALKEAGCIVDNMIPILRQATMPKDCKIDSELPNNLTAKSKMRREELLRRGLSAFYVDLCFDGYEQGIISASRLAEVLLTTENELRDLANLVGRSLVYGD